MQAHLMIYVVSALCPPYIAVRENTTPILKDAVRVGTSLPHPTKSDQKSRPRCYIQTLHAAQVQSPRLQLHLHTSAKKHGTLSLNAVSTDALAMRNG